MSNPNRFKIGVTSDFPEAQAIALEVSGLAIVVCNYQGKLYAVENRCSHDQAELGGGEMDGCQIVCPRDQTKFDVRDGTVTAPPAVFPIDCYDITVRGKSVYVELEE